MASARDVITWRRLRRRQVAIRPTVHFLCLNYRLFHNRSRVQLPFHPTYMPFIIPHHSGLFIPVFRFIVRCQRRIISQGAGGFHAEPTERCNDLAPAYYVAWRASQDCAARHRCRCPPPMKLLPSSFGSCAGTGPWVTGQ